MKQFTVAGKALAVTFAVLWMVGCASTPEPDTTDADAERRAAEQAAADARRAAAQQAETKAQKALEDAVAAAGNVVYFDFDKSAVKPEYRGIVSAHAAYLAAHSSGRVTLEGHADERGTREYNLGLGERRGNSAMGLMSAQGARGSQTVVVSYGEERPNCRVSDEDCWWQNRRVEIVYTAR